MGQGYETIWKGYLVNQTKRKLGHTNTASSSELRQVGPLVVMVLLSSLSRDVSYQICWMFPKKYITLAHKNEEQCYNDQVG